MPLITGHFTILKQCFGNSDCHVKEIKSIKLVCIIKDGFRFTAAKHHDNLPHPKEA